MRDVEALSDGSSVSLRKKGAKKQRKSKAEEG